MKLEEGMYVRFDWKKQQIPILIGKITEVHYDEDEKYYFYLTDNGLVIGEDNLVKEPSHNIIDLIEVGDYVNGLQVIEVREHLHNDIEIVLTNGSFNWSFSKNESDYKIKSIVTKEQFEQTEYKVGE